MPYRAAEKAGSTRCLPHSPPRAADHAARRSRCRLSKASGEETKEARKVLTRVCSCPSPRDPVRRGRVPAPRGRPRSFPVSVAWSASFPPHHRCGAQLRGRLDLSQRYSCPAHPWSIRLGRESKLAAQAEGLFCFSLHSRLGLPITRGFSQIAPQKSEPLRGGGADRGRHLFQNGAHPSLKPPVLRRQVRSLGSSSRLTARPKRRD